MTVDASKKKIHQGVIRTVLFSICIIGLVLVGFFNQFLQPRILSNDELRLNNVWVHDKPRIVRDFSMLDQHSNSFTKANLQGKWSLVFFGFTQCPDVCPTALAEMKRLKGMLDQQGRGDDMQYMLMSVDPARDTQDVMKPYMAYFDNSFIGLSGDYLDTKKIAADFNVAFSKMVLSDNNYTVEHSGNIAIVNPFGDYHGFIRPPFNASQMALTMNSIRRTWSY